MGGGLGRWGVVGVLKFGAKEILPPNEFTNIYKPTV